MVNTTHDFCWLTRCCKCCGVSKADNSIKEQVCHSNVIPFSHIRIKKLFGAMIDEQLRPPD